MWCTLLPWTLFLSKGAGIVLVGSPSSLSPVFEGRTVVGNPIRRSNEVGGSPKWSLNQWFPLKYRIIYNSIYYKIVCSIIQYHIRIYIYVYIYTHIHTQMYTDAGWWFYPSKKVVHWSRAKYLSPRRASGSLFQALELPWDSWWTPSFELLNVHFQSFFH